jgi:hypothetical protein
MGNPTSVREPPRFSSLIANEIISVQPMTAPAGLLFYMDYRYDTPASGAKDG